MGVGTSPWVRPMGADMGPTCQQVIGYSYEFETMGMGRKIGEILFWPIR